QGEPPLLEPRRVLEAGQVPLAVVTDPADHARRGEDALGLVGTDVASGGAGLAGELVDGPLVLRRRHGDLPVTPGNSCMSERNIALCYCPRPIMSLILPRSRA